MKEFTVIAVYTPDRKYVRMVVGGRGPYGDKYNLPGGKVEDGETIVECAYRELYEETGIRADHVTLTHNLTLTYMHEDYALHFLSGTLNQHVALSTERGLRARWFSVSEDFSDGSFAGMGNLVHLVRLGLSDGKSW